MSVTFSPNSPVGFTIRMMISRANVKEKGYNPVNQIVGYIMSGDPTYITSHKGARSLIMKVERDELVEEMLAVYISHNNWDKSADGKGNN